MELNNQAKYDESIVTLEEIIADNSSTSLDKYYAYLNKALTYKRLFNYPEVLINLDLALKEGVKTDKKKIVTTQIQIEKMFIQFDLQKIEETQRLFNQIDPNNLVLIDATTRAFYLNVKSVLQQKDKDYAGAKKTLDEGIALLKKENPEHLPGVYCKIINLAGHTHDENMAKTAFEQGMYYVEKYKIPVYKIRLMYDLSHFYVAQGDYKKAYHLELEANEISGKYNAPFESGKLNLLEKELINKRRDLEVRNEKNIRLSLIIITVILLAFIVVLFLFFRANKQKRKLTEKDNARMRRELEKLSQELSEKEDNTTENFKEFNLSERQIEIIELVKQGKTNKEIASQLFISENTVKYHLKNIYTTLKIENRFDL